MFEPNVQQHRWMKDGMGLSLNALFHLILKSIGLLTSKSRSVTSEYKIWYSINRECTSQTIDYCRQSHVSHWNCINPFRIGIVND